MDLAVAIATAKATAKATAMAPLRAKKSGKARSRQELAQANVLLAKGNGYERGALA